MQEGKARTFTDPDAYIQAQPAERQAALVALRGVIRANLPAGYEETIQYGMIGYVVPHSRYPEGYRPDPAQPLPFIALANQKQYIALYHMGIYSDPALLSWFTRSYEALGIGKLDMGKSCIRFRRLDRIPLGLIGALCAKMSVEEYIHLYESSLHREGGERHAKNRSKPVV